jgi:hypothetical protein
MHGWRSARWAPVRRVGESVGAVGVGAEGMNKSDFAQCLVLQSVVHAPVRARGEVQHGPKRRSQQKLNAGLQDHVWPWKTRGCMSKLTPCSWDGSNLATGFTLIL